MSAGKGDIKRPFDPKAWDEGHERIWGKKLITPNHFAEVFKGSSDKPEFKLQAKEDGGIGAFFSKLPDDQYFETAGMEPQKCEICEALDSSIPI